MPVKSRETRQGCFKSVSDSFDMYGPSVTFSFKRQKKFPSGVGTVMTLLTIALMVAFIVNRTLKLLSKNDPFFSMLQMASEDKKIDLWALDYMFAVEKLDPEVGRVQATQTIWGKSVKKVKKNIELVDCTEFLPGGKYTGGLNNPNFSIESLATLRKTGLSFLCPYGIDEMTV